MKHEIPYALVPDYKGYPANSPLQTFQWEIDESIAKKLIDSVIEGGMLPDGFLIKQVSEDLYNELIQEVKRISPDWEEYAGIEIYIPEIIHMIANLRSMAR